MMIKWLVRLSFPALGLLMLLMFFGLNDPEQASSEPVAGDTELEVPAFEGLVPSPVPTDGPDIVFKWQDTDGNWHYADQPPEQGPWNALAIERSAEKEPADRITNPETDWQSPYIAPYSLNPNAGSNGS